MAEPTATTADTEPVEPWKKSVAKALLKQDIISGAVPATMRPKDVFQMRDEYKKYPYE